jgi:hypothetical protein
MHGLANFTSLWMLTWRWSNKTETCCYNKILIFLNCCCVLTVNLKHFVLLLSQYVSVYTAICVPYFYCCKFTTCFGATGLLFRSMDSNPPSEVHSRWVIANIYVNQGCKVIRNRMSFIIRRYTDHIKFYCFFLIILVLFCIIVYMVVCLVCFYLILYIMYSYCYVYVLLLLLCVFRSRYCVSLCCSVYCLRVNVYCNTATGCQPNCN